MEALQESVEEPEPPVMLVDDSAHNRLVDFVATARVTVPVKPFNGSTVMVEMAPTSAFTITLAGAAEIAKSWT